MARYEFLCQAKGSTEKLRANPSNTTPVFVLHNPKIPYDPDLAIASPTRSLLGHSDHMSGFFHTFLAIQVKDREAMVLFVPSRMERVKMSSQIENCLSSLNILLIIAKSIFFCFLAVNLNFFLNLYNLSSIGFLYPVS